MKLHELKNVKGAIHRKKRVGCGEGGGHGKTSGRGGKVLLRPASPGTGLIAGGGVRAVLEAAGVKNILTKSMGSSNHIAVVHATLNGLLQLRLAEQIKAVRKA